MNKDFCGRRSSTSKSVWRLVRNRYDHGLESVLKESERTQRACEFEITSTLKSRGTWKKSFRSIFSSISVLNKTDALNSQSTLANGNDDQNISDIPHL
ncbi:hypothetical protein CDAR_546251 [Caerostris darwini]|uniref:Uncharacterized protein n=1 Tax=Caerostris darwini TaxID=1538125 RepID=A0AAV4RLV9_9ARAC|nr:hypothetical protein CDAR_546251 [Caerostris darwini]